MQPLTDEDKISMIGLTPDQFKTELVSFAQELKF